jgi:murein DD-endopeptidase MepM/ murein hydrolase activator NlpD
MAPVTIPRQNWPYDPGPHFSGVSTFGPRYGKLHSGTDFSASSGSPIPAAADGKIVGRGFNENYGNWVIIEHQDPKNPTHHVYSTYAHLQDLKSTPPIGSHVKAGQLVGAVGSTGHSEGPHLHFELIRIKPNDPMYATWPPKEGWTGGATGIIGGYGRFDPLNASNWGGIQTYKANKQAMNPMSPMADMSPLQLAQQFTRAAPIGNIGALLTDPVTALRID